MLDRSIAPSYVPVKDIKLEKVISQNLKNGIPLYAINAGSQPVINLQLVFKAGKWCEKVQGSAIVLSKLMLEGTHTYTGKEINNFFDSHGIFWEISSGFDYLTIDIYLLSKYLPKISNILISILSEALLPENEFEEIRNRLKQQIEVNFEKTSYTSSITFREKLFGSNHPYGYILTKEQLNTVKYEDVVDYYKSTIQQKEFEIIVSGLVNDDLLDEISHKFGSVKIKKTPNLYKQEKVALNAGNFYYSREKSLQTSLRIGYMAPPKNSQDALCFELLNKILGGYFGSRLMKNLREEKGLTYGVHSSIVYMQNNAYHVISTDVIKEKREIAISEIYKEVNLLIKHSVSEEELVLVKNYVVGTFVKSINSPFSLVQHFKTVHYHNLEKDYYNKYVGQINEITVEHLLTTAQKYFDRPFLEVAVG